MFHIIKCLKEEDAPSPLFLHFALEYAIKRVQVNQDGLKLNDTYQLLVYTDDVNTLTLRGSVHTIKENAEALVVAHEEIGLEINADKTKHMILSRDQNAGRGHSVKIDNSSFERVEDFNYVGINLTNQNYIQEGFTSIVKSGNACYHLVQNLFSSSLLSKNLKIKIYRTVILPVVLYGYETWSLMRPSNVCRSSTFILHTCLIIHCLYAKLVIHLLLLLLLLLTAIELSLGSSSPYTSTDKTNKNKYT
jgi:hypothetical protein